MVWLAVGWDAKGASPSGCLLGRYQVPQATLQTSWMVVWYRLDRSEAKEYIKGEGVGKISEVRNLLHPKVPTY